MLVFFFMILRPPRSTLLPATTRSLQDYLKRSPFVAVVYLDGSAQLLSRDEDECRLFATLWELGK